MDGLLVQQPFADWIATGQKTWELRTARIYLPHKPFFILATRTPHRIARNYDATRLGVAVGIAESSGIEGPFRVEELKKRERLHRIPQDVLIAYAKGRMLYAMVLKARPAGPVAYVAKRGAITLLVDVQFA